MNRKMLLGIMMIGLVAALAGAGMYALFNDHETSEGNVFKAGTLNLQLGSGSNALISIDNMKPGDSGEVIVAVTNLGSLDGKLSLILGKGIPWNVIGTMVCSPDENLADALEFGALYDVKGDGTYSDKGWPGWGPGTVFVHLSGCNQETLDFGLLPAGGTRNVKIFWNLPSTVGNEVQGRSVTFDITFYLSQA